ncbi:hypothetical protein [Streptomyces antibioticus]|uniref:Uncharacterized protein n=1 Tax=Streptomyces antibioticus TaxID=1890 RepID=A0AAE6YF36_STRAT|nr:hypothetical protein [Streptomyces antibioticus]QIT47589.1 hypothetical protein HCX60_32030 [Streptomyces antibioticus]
MTGTAQVGLAVLALAFVMVVLVIRWALTPLPAAGRHRGSRRPVEEFVPGHHLIPALAVHGPGWPVAAFGYCAGCRAEVPVAVHAGAHRCDAHGHVTIHTAGGAR